MWLDFGVTGIYDHCGSQGNSAFQAFPWHSQFAFSLRPQHNSVILSVSLTLKIRIFATLPKAILLFKRFVGTQISHFRRGSQGNVLLVFGRTGIRCYWYLVIGILILLVCGVISIGVTDIWFHLYLITHFLNGSAGHA